VQFATFRELMRYWGTDYDWRKAKARLGALPQFTTMTDGPDNHFIHVRWPPLVMTHGEPELGVRAAETVGRLGSHAPWARGGRSPQRHGFNSRLRLLRQAEGHRFSPDRIARAWQS
jgi:hypothetical protein